MFYDGFIQGVDVIKLNSGRAKIHAILSGAMDTFFAVPN